MRPAETRGERGAAWTRRVLPLALVAALVLTAYSALTSDVGSGAAFAGTALVLGWALHRRRRAAPAALASTRARAGWDGARVRATAAAAGVDPLRQRVATVRAVRRADPRLTLRDAVDLVEAAAGPADR